MTVRNSSLPILSFLLLCSACSNGGEVLGYQERTGVNLSVEVSPSDPIPVEVNAGIIRRVASYTPRKNCTGLKNAALTACRADTDTVDMVSSFRLKQTKSGTGLFGGALNREITISTAFVSGAKTGELNDDVEAAKALTKTTVNNAEDATEQQDQVATSNGEEVAGTSE